MFSVLPNNRVKFISSNRKKYRVLPYTFVQRLSRIHICYLRIISQGRVYYGTVQSLYRNDLIVALFYFKLSILFSKFDDVQFQFRVLPQFPWDIYKYWNKFAIGKKAIGDIYIQTKASFYKRTWLVQLTLHRRL